MFCIKCGNKIPEVALHCPYCGAKTITFFQSGDRVSINADAVTVPKAPASPPVSNPFDDSKFEEELRKENEATLEKMQEKLDDLRDRKSTNIFVCIVLVIAALLFFCVGCSEFNSGDMQTGIMTAGISFAVGIGVFIGIMIRVGIYNSAIENQEYEIEEFERVNKIYRDKE